MTAARRLRMMQAATLAAFVLLALQLLRMHVIDAAAYRQAGGDGHMRVLPVEPQIGRASCRERV